MGFGAVGAYGAAGLQDSLEQLLAKRIAAQVYADKMRQDEVTNARLQQQADQQGRALDQNDQFRRDQLAETASRNEQQNADREAQRAQNLADTLPDKTFLEPLNPAVGRLQSHGYGALLQEQQERPEVLTGPLLPGDTGASRPRGFLKTASQKQLVDAQNRADKEADNARQAARDEQQTKYQNESLRIQGVNAGASAQARDLAAQLQELRIQTERDKLDRARTERGTAEDNAKSATQTALDLVDRLEQHPGLPMASGYISSRFSDFSQPATDANSIRDQLVAALALPNLGALKGPLSDKDILFIKQLATRLSNRQISEPETRKALAEAKQFLQSKVGQGAVQPMSSHGGGVKVLSITPVKR